MKDYLIVPAALLLLSGIAQANPVHLRRLTPTPAPLTDSIGVEKKDGKRFILHRVDQGQTLYSIARRYGRSVADIKAANPAMNESVRFDQVVRIPIPDGALSRKQEKAIDKAIRKEEKEVDREAKINNTTVAAARAKKAEDPARAGIHVVEPGQTLYSLAVRYGVSQADVRKWNSLSTDNVLIGQALIVSEKAYLDRSPASAPATPARTPDAPARPEKPAESRPAPVTRPEPKPERPATRPASEPLADNHKNDTPAPERTTPVTTKPADVEEVVELPRPGNDAPMPTRGRRMSSSGIAEMIEGADGSGKYLALHRTAPIGTLVQVRNEFNNQSLWVKVIGRLPDTGVNDKILVKLSTQAFAKLSPDDRRFRAEVSYIIR